MKDKEIEIKVQVEHIKKLLDFLKKNGRFVAREQQVDRYFTPKHRNFTAKRPVNEWLRLRNSAGKYSINYKNWHREKDGRTLFCDEFETALNDIAQMEKIFLVLDMKLLTTVDKTREIWLYHDWEIAIDRVKNLGEFVEIEFKGRYTSLTPRQITNKMLQFLKNQGCGQIINDNQGYPFHLLFPKEVRQDIY